MKLSSTLGLLALAPVVLLAPACVSVKSSMKSIPSAPISKRLPALEIYADQGPLAMNDGALPEDPLKLFQQECRQNLTEPTDSATYGYAKLVVKKVKTLRTGRGLQGIQVLTFMVPAIFGVPLEWYKTTLQAELQVSDASGNLLGTYTGSGNSEVKVAMYHGYSQTDAPRLADIIALRGAIAQIRPQIDTATARLRPLLLSGGTVENPTLPSSSVVTGSR